MYWTVQFNSSYYDEKNKTQFFLLSRHSSRWITPRCLLDAARQIFLEKGYAGTSIDEVVQRTGGSKASVYKYFGSKEGLFAEMFGTHCQVFLATLQIPNELSGNLEQTLTQFAERVLLAFVDPERVAMIRALVAEAARFPDLAEMERNISC